jgi:hypothetical protein
LNTVVHHSDIEENVRRHFDTIRKYRDIAKREAGSQLSKVSPQPFQLSSLVPETVAIDSSYAPLYQSSGMWLIAVRAVALKYGFSEDKEGTNYHLRGCEMNEGAELVTTSKRIAGDLSTFTQELRDRTSARRSEAPRRMGALATILREFQLANSMAKSLEKSIIMMDGTLTTPPITEIKELAQDAVKSCERNGNILVGVSKDSGTNLFGSIATDEELLRTVKGRELLYVKPPEPKRTALGPRGDVFFVKFHPDAPKWFRVDVAPPQSNPGDLLGSISQFARNQLCPGYPFPLAEAHMVAVELRKFPRVYDDLLFKVGQEMGFDFDEIAWGRTNIEGRRRDAFHAYLDILSKRGAVA